MLFVLVTKRAVSPLSVLEADYLMRDQHRAPFILQVICT